MLPAHIYVSISLYSLDAVLLGDSFHHIDDTMILVTGHNYAETHKKIEEMLHRQGGILQWADVHNCTFGIEKFQLVDFL